MKKGKFFMIRSLVQMHPEGFSSYAGPLKQRTVEVTCFGSETQSIIQDLKDTLIHHEISVGLAAPQIGFNVRIAVVNISKDRSSPTLVIVNPRDVIHAGKKDAKREACMSLPGVQGEVTRRDKIQFVCEDEAGQTRKIEASGFLARAYSHEIDHLDGFLYIDRMTSPPTLEPANYFSDKDFYIERKANESSRAD